MFGFLQLMDDGHAVRKAEKSGTTWTFTTMLTTDNENEALDYLKGFSQSADLQFAYGQGNANFQAGVVGFGPIG